MSALWSRVNRWLVWFHRWAGVALCLLVVAWFASGAIVHFVPYPALSRDEQLARAEPLALPRVRVDPETVLEQMPRARDLRLLSILGRPVYVGRTPGGTSVRVAADTGEVLPPLSADGARTVAAHFFGSASAVSVTGPLSYDQWIVHQHFDPYRPLFRVRMNDVDRTDVYVSAVTGEVVQRTRFSERAWNWPGAVLHWLYFTPLRKDWSRWNQSVWWISLITLLSATVGAWLGTVRLIANRSAGRPGLSPFRGWMRWHHIVGLFASVIVLGWIFSGWLSMDHGRIFSRGQPTEDQAARVSGMTLAAAAAAATAQSLRDMGRGVEISLHAIAGRPFLTIHDETATRSRVLWLGSADVSAALPDELLVTGLRAAWIDAVAAPPRFDDMYRLAEHLPPSARGFVSPGQGTTRIYIDPLSGEVLAVMDPGRRTYAWIYYALHTLNFPGLLSWPLARMAIEMVLLSAGLAFGVTGIILAFRRLRQELGH